VGGAASGSPAPYGLAFEATERWRGDGTRGGAARPPRACAANAALLLVALYRLRGHRT